MHPGSLGPSPSARRTSEITFARLFSSTITLGHSACIRNSFSSSSPRRSISSSSASKHRGNIGTAAPSRRSWRRATSTRRPLNSKTELASLTFTFRIFQVSGTTFIRVRVHSGQHGRDTQSARVHGKNLADLRDGRTRIRLRPLRTGGSGDRSATDAHGARAL
jgi:hypothetical protein